MDLIEGLGLCLRQAQLANAQNAEARLFNIGDDLANMPGGAGVGLDDG